jgi:hypothetical protein
MKRRLKKNYRVIDRKSDSFLVFLTNWIRKSPAKYSALLSEPEAVPDAVLDSCNGLMIAEGVSMSESWMKSESRSSAWKSTLTLHVQLLTFVARLFLELCDSEEPDTGQCLDDIFARLISGVSRASSGETWDSLTRDVLDDDYRAGLECVLRSASECRRQSEEGSTVPAALASNEIRDAGMVSPGLMGGGGRGLEAALDSLKDSALGKIAMELSESVDKDQLREAMMGADGGMEGMIQGLMTGESTGMIGDLLQKVSGTVMSRMQDGSLNMQDLMRDASSVMGAFGGAGMGIPSTR